MYATTEPLKSSFKTIIEKNTETGIAEINAKRDIMVSTTYNTITVSGLTDGEVVEAYSLQGTKLAQAKAFSSSAQIQIIEPQKMVILKVGNESIKVLM